MRWHSVDDRRSRRKRMVGGPEPCLITLVRRSQGGRRKQSQLNELQALLANWWRSYNCRGRREAQKLKQVDIFWSLLSISLDKAMATMRLVLIAPERFRTLLEQCAFFCSIEKLVREARSSCAKMLSRKPIGILHTEITARSEWKALPHAENVCGDCGVKNTYSAFAAG